MEAPTTLLVDAESRMRKLVRDFLEKKNFQVLEAGDGEEAMDIFYEEKDIALILLDVMMPKMDGWEVCREIRKNSKPAVPVHIQIKEIRGKHKACHTDPDPQPAQPLPGQNPVREMHINADQAQTQRNYYRNRPGDFKLIASRHCQSRAQAEKVNELQRFPPAQENKIKDQAHHCKENADRQHRSSERIQPEKKNQADNKNPQNIQRHISELHLTQKLIVHIFHGEKRIHRIAKQRQEMPDLNPPLVLLLLRSLLSDPAPGTKPR